jgi:starch synthase (maltosyl-transferring)
VSESEQDDGITFVRAASRRTAGGRGTEAREPDEGAAAGAAGAAAGDEAVRRGLGGVGTGVDGLPRICIENLTPATPSRVFPVKAVVGERVEVAADIFADGHAWLAARVRWRPRPPASSDASPDGDADRGTAASPRSTDQAERLDGGWSAVPMRQVGMDRWQAVVEPGTVGAHEIVVEAWRDRFATWRHDVEVKTGAGDDITVELEEGARLLEHRAAGLSNRRDRRRVRDAAAGLRRESCNVHVRLNAGLDDQVAALVAPVPDADVTRSTVLPLWVDRPRAGSGAWYELFPRSEGGFAGAAKRLPAVADMGFDVVYLPPIHPIGTTARKGKNNTLAAGPDDPGSPWAIGSPDGGHTAIDPGLGTLDDFRRFCRTAADLGLEVALDYALQCSPDHPWVARHPEWFWRRPDGTIRYAENPPKKYQDIYPINFWPDDEADRVALWEACRDVLQHWIDEGVRIFRVDNPHTKPLAFWAWVIDEVRAAHPDVIFLSEAFTKPVMMAKLAEVGFTQSYTYFTWRTEAWELREYVEELAYGPTTSYLRPNFWPNTPDILSGPLRQGPPAAFLVRFVLAATLVPNYGMYSGYELFENEPASDQNEEYFNSEKYEVRRRDWAREDSMAPFVARVNDIRRRHPALRQLRNVRFHHSSNDRFLVWSKGHARDAAASGTPGGDLVLVVVNLDPEAAQETVLGLDLAALGLPTSGAYTAHDELGGDTYHWDGPSPYVRLDPSRGQVAHILTLRA